MRQREGFFFPPKHSHEKFFRIFFKSTPSDFLLIFWREFVMGLAASCQLAMGGVSLSLLARLIAPPRSLFLALLPLSLRLCRRLFLSLCSLLACLVGGLPSAFLPFVPLSLWASVPDWLTASGHPLTIGSDGSIGASLDHREHSEQGKSG